MHWTEEEYADFLAARQRAIRAPHPPLTLADEAERDFQSRVMREAKRLGYRTYHTYRSDRSVKGWFDVALARPGDKLVLAELKRAGGKPSDEQRDWYEDLQRIDVVKTYLWYPKDFEEIVEILAQRK